MKTLSALLATLLAPGMAGADEVYLKSGGQLSGRVVSSNATSIVVDVGAGRITVATSSVLRIEEGRSPLQEYEERAAKLAPGDVAGWVALGEWASGKGLGRQSSEAYQKALAASPRDPRANAALGNQQIDGRWVSEEEGYRARGYVKFEGDWVTPAEHDAILRERAAADAAREAEYQRGLARQEADARTREAEARAREAEARAKEADAAAQQQAGLPLWYGWGAGPNVWPTGELVSGRLESQRLHPEDNR